MCECRVCICSRVCVFMCLLVCAYACLCLCRCTCVCYVSVCINFVFGVDLNSTQLGWRLIDTGVSGQPNA